MGRPAMPVTIPPFVQYQEPIIPLRGLWFEAPKEGPKFANITLSWVSYPGGAVQFQMAANSPVALSQIVALYVDNRRCGVDVDFLFTDTGFLLTVPAHAQGLFPVFTNGLMFYAIARGVETTDSTVVQVCNSLPPPVALLPSIANNVAASTAAAIVNGSTALIASTISGTLNALSITLDITSIAAASNATISLVDGNGAVHWVAIITDVAGGAGVVPINLSGLNTRFRDGLSILVIGAAAPIGFVTVAAYYQTP